MKKKIILVDGPHCGTTFRTESTPNEIIVPDRMFLDAHYVGEDAPPASLTWVSLRYVYRYQTRSGTYVYEYAGRR